MVAQVRLHFMSLEYGIWNMKYLEYVKKDKELLHLIHFEGHYGMFWTKMMKLATSSTISLYYWLNLNNKFLQFRVKFCFLLPLFGE